MNVSVIIPCYNGEEYIGQTLGSLLDQSRPADEIIVVDDGSNDRSVEIARSFGESVTVMTKQNAGAAIARNCGADHASGNALMFLDADDVLAPNALEYLVAELKLNPEGVVACPWYRLDKVGDKWVKRPPSCKPLGKNKDYLSGWITGWYHLPCSILWSRVAYERTGGWDPRAYVNDDGDLMMRALIEGTELQITDKGSAFYRRMPEEKESESLSGARFTHPGRQAQIYVMQKIAQRLADKGNLDPYRKPLTKALDQYRTLCQPQYPDLSEKCTNLTGIYGEPRYLQIVRKLNDQMQLSLAPSRRYLSKFKSELKSWVKQTGQNEADKKIEEIRFGIDTCRKVTAQEGKAKLINPSSPEVSVILTAYNQLQMIDRSLESVLNQSIENIEIIIIGNTSGEDTHSIKRQFGDPRIRYFFNHPIQDINAARNLGLRKVKGEFVAFLDQEDEWFPNKLSKQLELFKSRPDHVGLVYSEAEDMVSKRTFSVLSSKVRGKTHRELLLRNVIENCSSVMIRREVIPSVGFFDEALFEKAEHDYWLRIARYFEFDFIDDSLVKTKNQKGRNSRSFMKNRTTLPSRAQTAFQEKHLLVLKRQKTE